MVVIDKCKTDDFGFFVQGIGGWQTFLDLQSGLFRHILKVAILFIVKEQYAIAETHCKVSEAVVIVVSRCTRNCRSVAIQTSFFGHLFKLAIA